ncbi:hypothetical protein ACFLYO_02170 [Chloroflexota bacterium]
MGGFIDSNIFWMLMGMLYLLVMFAFKAFTEDRGWPMTWWKWVLCLLWYNLFGLSFYTYGTLAGENEADAGLKLMLIILFVSVILAVGLWRLLMWSPKKQVAA